MGITESSPLQRREDFIEQFDEDPTYPWLLILEYVADRMPMGIVRTYDFDAVRTIVLEASRVPLMEVHRWRTASVAARPLDPEEVEFATALLHRDENLDRMRYSYVPSLLSEEMFWTLYFDRLYSRVRQHLTRDSDASDKMLANSELVAEVLSFSNQHVRDIASSVCCPHFVRNFKGADIYTYQKYHKEDEITLTVSYSEEIDRLHWATCMVWLRSIDDDAKKIEGMERWFQSRCEVRHRLGDYFADCYEYYKTFFPENQDKFEKMAFTVQVHGSVAQGQKSTVGEFDALLLEREKEVLHHEELSVKYLLCEEWERADVGFSAFIGPHRTETMRDKIEKMSRQAKLSQNGVAREILDEKFGKNSHDHVMAQCILKGWLFYPLNANNPLTVNAGKNNWKGGEIGGTQLLDVQEDTHIDGRRSYLKGTFQSKATCTDASFPQLVLNSKHWHGWWTRSPRDIVKAFSFRNSSHRWLLVPKLRWGSFVRVSGKEGGLPLYLQAQAARRQNKVLLVDDKVGSEGIDGENHSRNPLPSVELLDDDQLVEAVEQYRAEALVSKKHRRLRVLIAELVWNTCLKAWVEVSRGFCVEENWPEEKAYFTK
jgi:hypothetical protein